mgnify:CR=1 FL=1
MRLEGLRRGGCICRAMSHPSRSGRVSRSIGSERETGRSGRGAIRAGAPGSVAAVRLPAAFPGRDLFPPRRFRCNRGAGGSPRSAVPQWLTMARLSWCAGRRICELARYGSFRGVSLWFTSSRVPGAPGGYASGYCVAVPLSPSGTASRPVGVGRRVLPGSGPQVHRSRGEAIA